MAEPFIIAVPDDRLAAIRAKVEAFDWSIMPDAGGWQSGVGLADLKRLVDYWLADYDWRAQERRLNMLPQFTADVQGQRLHFIHARGDGSRPPLLLLHGWPGSFLEFEALIAPLVADGHDVVVPSLPGYAFSGRPVSPIGPKQTAELMHGLMVKLFGARRYAPSRASTGQCRVRPPTRQTRLAVAPRESRGSAPADPLRDRTFLICQ